MSRRDAATQSAPLGLALALSMIRERGETPTSSQKMAERAYPLASEVVTATFNAADERVIMDVLRDAPLALYPGLEGEPLSPDSHAEAGFYVGFCVCWLLMQQFNGGAR